MLKRSRSYGMTEQLVIENLLPRTKCWFFSQQQGPYQVLSRVGKVNYLVDMHDRRKRRCIFHDLGMFQRRTGYFCEEDEVTEQEVSDVNEDQPQQLSEQQWAELRTFLTEFSDVMKTIPGRTNLVEHDIQTGEAHPVRLPPYRLPHAYRDSVQNEIKEMLEQGIIEPSLSAWSAWSAPIVLVKKKDMEHCVCV